MKKNAAAVTLAKMRAKSMTPERRSEIARLAVRARWARRDAAKARESKEPEIVRPEAS